MKYAYEKLDNIWNVKNELQFQHIENFNFVFIWIIDYIMD